MSRLLAIRHLPTEYNQRGLLQGRLDIPIAPLDEASTAGIRANSVRIAEYGSPSVVVASTLLRTIQTAVAYGYGESHVISDPLLDEIDFGPYEGRPKAHLLTSTNGLWIDDPRGLMLGESVSDLVDRVRGFWARYREERLILAFVHGAWLRALLALARDGDVGAMNRTETANNALVVVDSSRHP